MYTIFTLNDYDEAAAFIRARFEKEPTVGLILGSGLSPLAEAIEEAVRIPYSHIPHFPVSTVEGHAGQLVIGQLAGVQVCAMQGRFHFYEGYTPQQITFPVRVMQRLGIKQMIVTNAAGGLNPTFRAGELMLIEDHLNFVGMGGNNPLYGPNIETFGLRFPSMTKAYSPRLRGLLLQVSAELGIPVQRGVYAMVAGPSFETPAEVRFLRTVGADAVGMSTAPEVIVAHHAGMEVMGISSITNVAVDVTDSAADTSHTEVLETGAIIVPRLTQLLMGVLKMGC
ncbi:MAG: purine-nucleoside phosphorylase [Caldilineaceae bacterium]|nr:purine-nucleoside phosphorylase [Caldilineaceae bacterium]HRJ43068.1 purine-nucleoside phosphorylase [Caldilineaceae bacterium]